MTSPVVTYGIEIVEDEFQANTHTTDTQWTPDVLGLSDGGYVVAYSNGPTAISGGVYIRLDFYDASGVLVAGSVKPYSSSSASNGAPSLTELDNGNVLVVWKDNLASKVGIYGTIYSETGEVVVPEFQLDYWIGDKTPQVTALEDGGFVLSYADTDGNVFFKVFDDNGDFQDIGGFGIDSGSTDFDPVITALEDGGFVITWTEDVGSAGGDYDIVARIFEADGTPREVNGSTGPFTVGTTGTNDEPAVTALPNGNFAVVYADSGWSNEDTGITLTIVGPDGELVTPYVQVNTPTVGIEADPDITVLDNGFIVVSWTDPATGGDILCRVFDQDGNVVPVNGGAPINISSSPTADVASAISGILAGEFIVGWQDSESDGDEGMINAVVADIVRTTTGTDGDDTLTGDELHDVMYGQKGDDTLNGGDGDDTLEGGADDDTLNGGDGSDAASYAGATAGVTVALTSAGAQNTGGAGIDTLTSIESLVGSAYKDTLTGTGGANTLSGGGDDDALSGYSGNDRLEGGAGNDALSGGDGHDTASYATATAGVTVSLALAGAQNTGGAGTDTLISIEHLVGSAYKDTLTGNNGQNTLSGGGNDDVLNGGIGADTMLGGSGNDTYVVDSSGDKVTEAIGQGTGIDTVQSSVSYTLGANVEKLTLTGNAGTNGTGNELDNTIIGNSGVNLIDGGVGADNMQGGNGNDTYRVESSGDAVTEAAGFGVDTVQSSITYSLGANVEKLTLTGSATINGFGNSLANTLIGNSKDNILNGGLLGDNMQGGGGNDTYVVDNAGDVVVEASDPGVDLVQSSVSFTLSANVEKLTLTGNAGINGTGNSLQNTIVGNSGVNLINGGGGIDTMQGGGGNDTYMVDNYLDLTIEGSNAGIDTVQSSVAFTLAPNVENLTLTGTAGDAIGNALANTIVGNSSDNRIDGEALNDILTGGEGADFFIFDDGDGIDKITDFQADDLIDLTAATGIDEFSDLVLTDTGAGVKVNYGTGSFELTNVADVALVEANDFLLN